LQQIEGSFEVRNLEIPKLVVLDLDDTLYDYQEANRLGLKKLVMALSEYGQVSENEVISAVAASRSKVKKRLGETASSHSRILYISETFRQLNLKPNTEKLVIFEELYWNTFLYSIQLFSGVEKMLKLFQRCGTKIVLVTDLTSSIQYRKVNKLGLNGYFDIVITSEEAGGDKSTGMPFRMLEDLTNLDCTRAWFFGDSDFDHPRQSNLETLFFKKSLSSGLVENDLGYQFSEYSTLENIFISFASR
jgi:FMN phosphatase YigB (HAD superfamily)